MTLIFNEVLCEKSFILDFSLANHLYLYAILRLRIKFAYGILGDPDSIEIIIENTFYGTVFLNDSLYNLSCYIFTNLVRNIYA